MQKRDAEGTGTCNMCPLVVVSAILCGLLGLLNLLLLPDVSCVPRVSVVISLLLNLTDVLELIDVELIDVVL